MRLINRSLTCLALSAFAAGASPAVAEVVEAHDDHFITRAEAIVDASAKETWLALISPARWWDSSHTWSADAANLKLTPQAGGCFCETIPEVNEPNRFTLEGSVEHMRVIQAYPEVALRMSGALGPLQSEPVTGILTIAMSDVEPGEGGGARTRIVWEYNVGGKMRYPVPVISNAVDGVMTLQLTKLAELLGPVQLPSSNPAPEPEAPDQTDPAEASEDPAPDTETTESVSSEPSAIPVELDALDGELPLAPADGFERDVPSVDDAFDDLASEDDAGGS